MDFLLVFSSIIVFFIVSRVSFSMEGIESLASMPARRSTLNSWGRGGASNWFKL